MASEPLWAFTACAPKFLIVPVCPSLLSVMVRLAPLTSIVWLLQLLMVSPLRSSVNVPLESVMYPLLEGIVRFFISFSVALSSAVHCCAAAKALLRS